MKKTYSLCVLLFVSFQIINAQSITGKVSAKEDGAPLIGVSVFVKGTTSGTITDENGDYSINAVSKDVLVFTYLGYESQEVSVGSQSVIDLVLATDIKTIDEIIVTGYGTQIKRDLTGNIAKIKGSEIRDVPTPTIENAIQGMAPGVQVNAGSGKLGQAMQIRIRGNSSVSASNEPLYVVDGIPITVANLSGQGGSTNSIVDINPQDVESIEILKDASAAAIYGARASNGVVLITTKKGKEGRTNVNFGVQLGNSKATRQIEFLNTKQYIDYYTKAAQNADRLDGLDPTDPNSTTTYIKDFMNSVSLGTLGTANEVDTKWGELAFQDAPYKQYDVSVDGGSAKTKFFVSGQLLDQTGHMLGNAFKRMTGRLNLDHQANKYLTIGLNMSMAKSFNERLSGDRQFDNPLQAVALPPMSPLNDPATGLLIGSPPGDITIPTYYNPLLNIGNQFWNTSVHRNLSNVYGVVKIIPGLTFRTELAVDMLNQGEESYSNSITQRNTGFAKGTGTNQFTRVENLNTNNFFNYNKKVGVHNIDFTAGMSYQQSRQDFNSVTGTDFASDSYKKLASAANITAGTSTETNFRFTSYFARANYKLLDKYIIGLSSRIDGSSRFGSNSRYGFFPAVSGAWIISSEGFLQESKAISFLKLRASYGRTGNAEIGNFPQLGLFGGGAGYGGLPGQAPTQLGNPDLKWETSDQVDIGLDFGLFNDRVNGEIDVYSKNSSDLLLNVNVPASTGFSNQVRNVGELENKGIEFALNANVLNVGSLKWNIGGNFGLNRNKILNIQGQIIEGGFGSMSRAVEGQPLGTFFTVEFAGVAPETGDAIWYKNSKNSDGTLDRATTNKYSEAQRVVIGNAMPKWIGGLTTNIQFKGFELNALLNTVQGNKINFYGAGQYASANGRYEDNQTVDQLNSWTPENKITNTPEARLYYNNGAQASSRFVQDGSYVRLRNVTLSYRIPTSILKLAKINSARLFITGMNLKTWTNYTGWDPEVNADDSVTNIAQGYDFYSAPMPRTILGGINIQF